MTNACTRLLTAVPTISTVPAPEVSGARQRMLAALAAANARWRAEQEGRRRPMSPAELAAFEAHWRERTLRALRAKEAQREKRRTRRAQADNPAPADTGMWAVESAPFGHVHTITHICYCRHVIGVYYSTHGEPSDHKGP